MRKTIKMDDALWIEFKEQCKKIGRDYHWVAEELLKNWLVKQHKRYPFRGNPVGHVDHVFPRSRGGQNEE